MAQNGQNEKAFKPYIAASDLMPEFTPKAIILGAIFGIIFGAATVYLGLKVGLTVSASIPIAVLAIAVFKKIGNSTILENNIVQTIGSAGESVAAGVVFTIPALLFLDGGVDYFEYFQILVLALAGGILGVLFMVPLRRALIVKEHGVLPYPEGTACADVLIAGEKGGNLAQKVYYGLGAAFLYKVFMSIFGFWKETPTKSFAKDSNLPNGTIMAEISPELLGVGYIIGPKISGVMVAGGVLSWLVLIPLITLFGSGLETAFPPVKSKLIADMTAREIWSNYIRYIGAGAVTFAGIMTLIKTIPTIISAFRDSLGDIKSGSDKSTAIRTEKDLPIIFVLVGAVVLVAFMAIIPSIPTNFLSAIMIVIFGFFFVTVSSRIVGILGSSSNPISGMTIATLMATSLIFVGLGWTDSSHQPIALVVGSIVCIAAANAGATSQDLKTGYLVGATPVKQQWGLIIGVVASSFVIGGTMLILNNAIGIGADSTVSANPLPAPQATLMATVIKGLLSQDLPWGLVITGMAMSAVVELMGIRSLTFAVGAYLPLSTTAPIFIGGLVKWLVERKSKSADDEGEIGPGALFSSGLIAGGSLTGILLAILIATEVEPGKNVIQLLNLELLNGLGGYGDLISLGVFVGLGAMLYKFATAKEKK